MAIFTSSWLLDTFGILTALVALLITWLQRSHTYWQNRGLQNPTPSLFFGNCKDVFTQKISFAEFTINSYNYFRERKLPHGGVYMLFMSLYIPVDPEIVKNIMQNDFDHFVDRGVYLNEEGDPLSAHLFSLEENTWRNLRIKLTPTFTSGKMKMMFDTLVNCSDQLTIEMDKLVGKKPIDIKEILVRFTMDIIGSCAFGIDCNSLKNPDNEFNLNAKSFFHQDFVDNIIGILTFAAPRLMKRFNTKAVKPSLSKFFLRVVRDTVEYREKNNIYRKDFMHLLLQLKNRGKLVDDESVLNVGDQTKNTDVKLSFEEIAAQAFVFFLAGFETSSTTMTFCLFELASNPEIQEKLREEVNQVLSKYHGKITYEAVMEMHYMEKVINETLRKFPPLPALNRICTKEYKIPGTNVVLEKGTKVFIPVLAMQHDEEYYPNPEKFDPDRFSEENKRNRPAYTYLPFGEGPRNCIGLRFGMMQTKVGISVLLKNYRFSVNSKTSLPLKLNPRSFIMECAGGIWLDCEKV